MDERLIVMWLFFAQGILGAFDTLYYHEWRARLPALQDAKPELLLHGIRSLFYGFLFAYIPFFQMQGICAWLIMGLIFAEIFITLADFVVEDKVRASIGGVFPGERVGHAIMAIVYGAVLAHLLPILIADAQSETGIFWLPVDAPDWLSIAFVFMAIGVLASGLRDLYACTNGPYSSWPWASDSE